eukprot:g2879.t1
MDDDDSTRAKSTDKTGDESLSSMDNAVEEGRKCVSSIGVLAEKMDVQAKFVRELFACVDRLKQLDLERTRDALLAHKEKDSAKNRDMDGLRRKLVLSQERLESSRQEILRSETERARLTMELANLRTNCKKDNVRQRAQRTAQERDMKEASARAADVQKKLVETEFKFQSVSDELKLALESLQSANVDNESLRIELDTARKDMDCLRSASSDLKRQFETHRQRSKEMIQSAKQELARAKDRNADLERQLSQLRTEHVEKLQKRWDDSKARNRLEDKLAAADANISDLQRLVDDAEGVRDEWKRKCDFWQQQAQQQTAEARRTIEKCERETELSRTELFAAREQKKVDDETIARLKKSERTWDDRLKAERERSKMLLDASAKKQETLRGEIEMLMTSLKASNRALEAMRNRQRTNPKDEAAALVRAQLEEWEREKESLSAADANGTSTTNDDAGASDDDCRVPVVRRDFFDAKPATTTATPGDIDAISMDMAAMCEEAKKIEARIRHKRGTKQKRRKKGKGSRSAAIAKSPYA